jgi:hypothetical protein
MLRSPTAVASRPRRFFLPCRRQRPHEPLCKHIDVLAPGCLEQRAPVQRLGPALRFRPNSRRLLSKLATPLPLLLWLYSLQMMGRPWNAQGSSMKPVPVRPVTARGRRVQYRDGQALRHSAWITDSDSWSESPSPCRSRTPLLVCDLHSCDYLNTWRALACTSRVRGAATAHGPVLNLVARRTRRTRALTHVPARALSHWQARSRQAQAHARAPGRACTCTLAVAGTAPRRTSRPHLAATALARCGPTE